MSGDEIDIFGEINVETLDGLSKRIFMVKADFWMLENPKCAILSHKAKVYSFDQIDVKTHALL